MTTTKGSDHLKLNLLIGALASVLLVLIIAVVYRLFIPRIQAERQDHSSVLISHIIQVQVLNGAGEAGLASRFTNALRKSGFDVVETGNFETFDIKESFVIDRIGNLENARRVAQALGIAEKNIMREISPGFYLDATVVIGSDYSTLNIP